MIRSTWCALASVLFLIVGSARPALAADAARAKYAVVIGLDGCRPEAIQQAGGPALQALVRRGTVCWRVEAAKPTVTQVNWACVLTGCSPAKHGIDMNPVTEEKLAGVHVRVPTIMQVVAGQGGKAVAMLGHWKLYPSETAGPGVFVQHSPYQAREAAPIAAKIIERDRPQFLFVYFGNLDGLGHKYGWMSPEYLAGMGEIDAGVKTIVDALERAGILDQTVVLITSDHGGHDKSHSAGTVEDTNVPWIIAGPGVRAGAVLDGPFSTVNTAPTLLRALGIAVPTEWEGRAVAEAFAEGASPATRPVATTAPHAP